jgi:site-specific recombinase XerD
MYDVDAFTGHLRDVEHLASSTTAAYRREVLRFQLYLKGKRLRLTQLKPRTITLYLSETTAFQPIGPDATQRRLSALNSYFAFVEHMSDGRIRNPVRLIKRPRRQEPRPKAVDDTVIEALLDGITIPRDKAIVMLFLSSALRIEELVSLDKTSIRVEVTERDGRREILGAGTVIGKGNKEREFLVSLPTLEQLHRYARERGDDDNSALFLSNRKQRISVRAVRHMLSSWAKRLGLPHIHPHALRHTASSQWRRLGIGLFEISKLLGHASLGVTDRYLAPDRSRMRAEYFAALEAVRSAALPAGDDGQK